MSDENETVTDREPEEVGAIPELLPFNGLPIYNCHKQVGAFKIKEIVPIQEGPMAGGATLVPKKNGVASFVVDAGYLFKHDPQVYGYYVIYKDGYESYSPEDVFEAGYLLA